MSKGALIGAAVVGVAVVGILLMNKGGGEKSPRTEPAPSTTPSTPAPAPAPVTPPAPAPEKPKTTPPPAPPPAKETPKPPAATGGFGVVEGTVRFEGTPPAATPVEVTPGHKDIGACGVGATVPNESLLVDAATKGIANAVVTLEPLSGGAPAAAKNPVQSNQRGCVFAEHVLIVPSGAQIEFKNSDAVSHNVKAASTLNASFNDNLDPGKSLVKKMEKPERIQIQCSVHPWMSSWVVVTDAPHYAKTDAQGRFKIENVPAGAYKVKVWQEKIGAGSKNWSGPKEIAVKPGESAEVEFTGSLQ